MQTYNNIEETQPESDTDEDNNDNNDIDDPELEK